MSEFDIAAWIRGQIEGPTGMNSFEDHEMVIWHLPDRVAAADWIIRCLANPNNKGSGLVLEAIQQHRVRLRLCADCQAAMVTE